MKGKPAEHEPYPAEILAIRRMPYGLRGFRRFAKLLGLRIWPFQAYLLGFYFAGVTELVILIPKKNGKTTLLAALALYHLIMVPHAEAVIGASSKEQAALLHRQATMLIEKAGLERHALPGDRREPTRYTGVFEVREGMHVIRFENGRLRVMPHEVRTADGVIPTLALVDELHRHPTGGLYNVYRNGLVEGAQMITISTAGASLDSPLGRLLEKAQTDYSMEKTGRRRTYTSRSGGFVLVEHALDPEDDRDDIKLVKQVNPAPWLTPHLLRERHPDNSPMESRGSWARLTCNLWTEGDEPAIEGQEWDRLQVDIGQIEDGEQVILVPSVGHNAAVAIVAPRPEGRVACKVEILEAAEGSSILARTENLILDLCERYQADVHHPLGAFTRSSQLLQGEGILMAPAPHSVTALAAASGTFNRLLRSGLLMHDGDPVLRTHVLAAKLKTNEAGERYEITDRARGLIALVMAVHGVTEYQPEPYIGAPSEGIA